jgi:hypothetical protein
MIFSTIVSVLLLGLIVYALLQKREFPVVGRLMPLVALLGIYVAWFPERTTEAASWVGVGRGVDLMLYVWVLVSGILILALHLKLITYERKLTALVRFLAIHNATAPESAQPESSPPPPG